MAINISNLKDSWTIKFYKEEWFFKDLEEFVSVFDFLVDDGVSFHVNAKSKGFSINMPDANLSPCDYVTMKRMLDSCLDYKKRFGDSTRLGTEIKIVADDEEELF